ncbi:MAG: Bug family tripartite tricarboxylate transporter substrate binding protein [Hyphomicrobiaceae bacterium]
MWRASSTLLLSGFLLAAPLAAALAADPVADFYRGKNIQMIIATSPGGDYDRRARLISRHMGKHLPGHPTFVPTNMPGAVGVAAANYLANVAPRDGTVMHAIMQNMPSHQATGRQGVKFDVQKFIWIGNTTNSPNVINSWYTTGITSIEQVMTKELVVGAPGTATSSVYYPLAMNQLVGTKFKIISGYPGGAVVNIAMERGEVGGRGSNSWASWKSTKPDWLREKKIHILVQIALKRHPDLKDIPLMMEFAKNETDRQVLEFLSSDMEISRAYVTTPDVPADRVNALRRAFDATMKDKEFLAEATKMKMDIEPSTGEEAQKVAASIVNAPADDRARARESFEGTAKTERVKLPAKAKKEGKQ